MFKPAQTLEVESVEADKLLKFYPNDIVNDKEVAKVVSEKEDLSIQLESLKSENTSLKSELESLKSDAKKIKLEKNSIADPVVDSSSIGDAVGKVK